MSRKADPSSRRSPRRRTSESAAVDPHLKPARKEPPESIDSDFGLCFALAPALRRRNDT
jgi:hypothetical protein